MYDIKSITAADAESLASAVKAYLDGPHTSTTWTLISVNFISGTQAFVINKA